MRDFALLLPEVLLALTLAGVVAGEITYHGERLRLIHGTAFVGLGAAFLETVLTYRLGAGHVFKHAVVVDGLALFFKMFFIVLAGLSILVSTRSRELDASRQAEFCALVIAATLAMCVAASSLDLVLIFLCLQAANVFSYFLAAYSKRSSRSAEAAIKYLLFGSVCSGLLLYGMAFLFSATHSLNLQEMRGTLAAAPFSKQSGLVIFMLIFLALSFQLAAFPMHLWAPDVLEGAPTTVSSFIATGSRAAGFAVAIRFLLMVFSRPGPGPGQWQAAEGLNWTEIVGLMAGLSMVAGAFLALRQPGAKRLVAGLVVSETGFLLLGLVVLDEAGISALLYSLVVELFALTGTYYVLSFFFDQIKSDRLSDFKGILKAAVPETVALVIFLAALVGLPPLPGFIGKFTLLGSAVRHQRYILGAAGVLSFCVSTAAVARLAYSMVGNYALGSGEIPAFPMEARRRGVLIGMLVVLAGLLLFANPLLGWTTASVRLILW